VPYAFSRSYKNVNSIFMAVKTGLRAFHRLSLNLWNIVIFSHWISSRYPESEVISFNLKKVRPINVMIYYAMIE
jgi:hypothetical protein